MNEEISERKIFVTFEKYGEFAGTQKTFLASNLFEIPSAEDDKAEAVLFNTLSSVVRLLNPRHFENSTMDSWMNIRSSLTCSINFWKVW